MVQAYHQSAGLLAADGTLEVRELRFRHAPHLPELFDGLGFQLAHGQRLLVQGPSGRGKSTLRRLLAGILGPDSGQVLLGGVPLEAIEPGKLRAHVGWMPQRTTLFHDTLAANLRLAAPKADDEQLIEVLDRLQLGTWLRELPRGLETWLGEHGKTVSGGQARRIELARMILADFPILILDEPLRGLDRDTALHMWWELEPWWRLRSIVFLAHDAGLLHGADWLMDLKLDDYQYRPVSSKSA